MVIRLLKHDTIAAAKLVGSVSALSSAVGLFANPVIGSLSDAIGRRPVLLLAAAIAALRHAVWLVRPSIPVMVLSELLAPVRGPAIHSGLP